MAKKTKWRKRPVKIQLSREKAKIKSVVSKKEQPLRRSASWIEAIWEYKGTKLVSKKDADNIKNIFNKFYEEYQKCEKN